MLQDQRQAEGEHHQRERQAIARHAQIERRRKRGESTAFGNSGAILEERHAFGSQLSA